MFKNIYNIQKYNREVSAPHQSGMRVHQEL